MRGAKPQLVTINGTLVQFPPPPGWLSSLAQDEWRRMQPFLEERKHLNDVDIANLENYCIAQGRVRECEAMLPGVTDIDDRAKVWRMQNQAMQTARQLAAELGLTPMSRSRVAIRDLFDNAPSPLDV